MLSVGEVVRLLLLGDIDVAVLMDGGTEKIELGGLTVPYCASRTDDVTVDNEDTSSGTR